jgi:hypothetical protein
MFEKAVKICVNVLRGRGYNYTVRENAEALVVAR